MSADGAGRRRDGIHRYGDQAAALRRDAAGRTAMPSLGGLAGRAAALLAAPPPRPARPLRPPARTGAAHAGRRVHLRGVRLAAPAGRWAVRVAGPATLAPDDPGRHAQRLARMAQAQPRPRPSARALAAPWRLRQRRSDSLASGDQPDGEAGPGERVGVLGVRARAGEQDGGAVAGEGAEAVDVGGAEGGRLADGLGAAAGVPGRGRAAARGRQAGGSAGTSGS